MEIVHRGLAPPAQWCPLTPSATVYMNSLVAESGEGVTALSAASGAGDTSGNSIIYGLAVGHNRATPLYSTTYKEEYITDAGAADPHDGASVEFTGVEGPWAVGDASNMAMVQVERIYPWTILKAPLYASSVGTAPTVLTATGAETTGLTITTNATQFTVQGGDLETIYCRSGANAGSYRITDDSSTTVCTWDRAMVYDAAAGDTYVRVPYRTIGSSYAQTDSTCASFLDCASAPATNYWHINVHRLDLRTAGEEYIEFSFDLAHFAIARASNW